MAYAITKINNFDTDTALCLFIAKIQRIDKNDFKNSTEILLSHLNILYPYKFTVIYRPHICNKMQWRNLYVYVCVLGGGCNSNPNTRLFSFSAIFRTDKARSIWYSGGGGLGFFSKKNFLALILAKKYNLAQWHCEKNNLSPIVTQNSLIGMFEMSKSKKFSGSLRSPEEYHIKIRG